MADENLLNAARAFLETHAEWEKITQEEIRLLRNREIRAAEEIMKKKPPLVDLYQSQLRLLFENREQLSDMPDDMKAALRDSQTAFASISGEYQRELDMALTSAERLMNLIKDTITKLQTTSQFYGKSGALTEQEAPRSFTVNKKA